jgi:hypothetical protein
MSSLRSIMLTSHHCLKGEWIRLLEIAFYGVNLSNLNVDAMCCICPELGESP